RPNGSSLSVESAPRHDRPRPKTISPQTATNGRFANRSSVELDALLTARLVSRPSDTVLRQDVPPVVAFAVIVVHVAVTRRILHRSGVIRQNLHSRHSRCCLRLQ